MTLNGPDRTRACFEIGLSAARLISLTLKQALVKVSIGSKGESSIVGFEFLMRF